MNISSTKYQQTISTSNQIDHMPWSSRIYLWTAKMVQYTQINKYAHHIKRMKENKILVISINAEKYLIILHILS
jgi:hypothetical protein